jgi:FkbM family methyltransferase
MQKLGRKFSKLFLLFPAWFRLGNFKWAYRLAEENFSQHHYKGLLVKDGNLVAERTGIALTDEIYQRLKGGLKYWAPFAQYEGVEFFGMQDGYLMTTIDKIRFRVDHNGSLFILDEIFAERLYDLRVEEDLVVVDVGMNVGVATLFFASWPNVKAVFGYEPLPDTYLQAKHNFSINPSLASKIKPVLSGISDYEGKITVPAAVSGSAVFSTDATFIAAHGMSSGPTVEVDIMHIGGVLENIHQQFPRTRVLLKLDCEGEEYRIMDYLSAHGMMDMISVVALELHGKGYQSLCDMLKAHHFSVFNLGRKDIDPPVGMIYAFNMKTKTDA